MNTIRAINLDIREIKDSDFESLLRLYTHLHNNPFPVVHETLLATWQAILSDPNHHIVVGIHDGAIIASCVVIIVPNLTHNQQPYALIENVVTHTKHRNKGYASAILSYAKQIAVSNQCYKMMLMTGSKEESILHFYEKAGYNKQDKTAFVQWVE